MNAVTVTEAALKKIREGCPVILMNYANPDMVGHSGILDATIKAVETIDICLGRLANEVLSRNGTMIITADHGNCEQMFDENGGPHTAHTLNPVPFVLIGNAWKNKGGKTPPLRSGGGLQDVAPTILNILKIPQPPEMTGKSLIIDS